VESVLLVEETGVPGEDPNVSQVTDKRHHIMLYRVHFATSAIRTHNYAVRKNNVENTVNIENVFAV
jgi:hypothetical protein